MNLRTIWLTTLATAAVGCATPLVTSTGPRRIHSSEQARLEASGQSHFVPAGTRFTARLDRALDTLGSGRGDRFNAVLVTPLVARDGSVIAPANSQIVGHVDSVNGVSGPRLRLAFDGVNTVHGFVPMEARVNATNAETYAGPPRYTARPFGYDSWYGPYYGSAPWGGGPSGYVYEEYRPREVHLPAGATLDLTLTRPLTPR